MDSLLEKIDSALSEDDLDLFIDLNDQLPAETKTFELGQKFLITACENRSICCATLLLMRGDQTGFTPDVNEPLPPLGKHYPLHYAAHIANPGTVELLIYYGADPNKCSPVGGVENCPPLLVAVQRARVRLLTGYFELDKVSSFYQLVTLICLHNNVLVLECTELLAWKTQGSLRDLVFWTCVQKKDFISLIVLLVVAHKLLGTAIEQARQPSCHYLEDFSEREKEDLTTLLNVFEKSGDTIEAYIREKRQKATRPSIKEVSKKVADWLGVKPADTDLRSIDKRVIYQRDDEVLDVPLVLRDDDAGFGHYGTSGRRWMRYAGGKDPKLASKDKDYGEELLGRRIMVWWPLVNKYYEGLVTSFDPSEKKHQVSYVGADEVVLNLRKERWNLIDDLSPELEQAANHPGSAPLPKKQKKEPRSSTNLHVALGFNLTSRFI